MVRHFDKSSSRYYWHNRETGDSTWEDDPSPSHLGAAEEHGGRRARYMQHETHEGDVYFVPESGQGKTLWFLPEGAELVD